MKTLTREEIAELPADTEVEIVWSGGNGPHRYRIWIDTDGTRCADNIYHDPLSAEFSFIGPESPYTVVRLV